jgi:hypothetical protein
MRYEVTISRVLHEVHIVDTTTIGGISGNEAYAKARELASRDYDAELNLVISLLEQGREDKYFDAMGEILETLRRHASARTLDVTVESVEVADDREVVVCESGLVRPRLLEGGERMGD